MPTCERCEAPLTGRQTRFCSKRCASAFYQREIPERGGAEGGTTDEHIRVARLLFPSLDREWDVDMVTACRRPIVALIATKLERRAARGD